MELFPSIDYFRAAVEADTIIVDDTLRHDKRNKSVHRYEVADVRGRLSLTVPVGHPPYDSPKPLRWDSIPISDHGQWWHVHRVTLESGYGRTPYFEFYVDRLARFFDADTMDRYSSVADMCRDAYRIIWQIIGMPGKLIFASELQLMPAVTNQNPAMPAEPQKASFDSSQTIIPYEETDVTHRNFDQMRQDFDAMRQSAYLPPYYQVRSAQLGFIPHLSILDLIFNLGPESLLYLLKN